MEDKEPLTAGPRLNNNLEEEPQEPQEPQQPINRRGVNISQLIYATTIGGLVEIVMPTPSDAVGPDVCFSLNLGVFYFGINRFVFRSSKTYPIRYSLEDSFYFAAGIMLGRSMVKAARNIYMNTF